jgi:hypothetical protein
MKHKIKKKSQAALEFLMTYGWAFALILISLSVLTYIGVFDTSKFVSEECTFLSGIYCLDSKVNTTGAIIIVQNGVPFNMENITINIKECSMASGPSILLPGESGNYTANCVLYKGTVFKSAINLNFTNPDSGLTHSKIGRLTYVVS